MSVGVRGLGSVLLGVGPWAAPPLAAAAKTSGGCGRGRVVALEESSPVELSGSLEAPALAGYRVLRRARLPRHAVPALAPAGLALENELRGYYPNEIRLLAALPDGRRFFL